MLRVTLPFRRVSQQPLTTLASTSTVLLSLSMTVAGACLHWPSHLPFAIGIALTGELCKLALQCKGLELHHAAMTWRQHLVAATHLAVATVFVVGSVVASAMCMSQAEDSEQAHALQSSRAYASTTEALHNVDAQMATLRRAADSDIVAGYRKRGLATLDRVQILSDQRKSLETDVLRLERGPKSISRSTFPETLALIGIDAPPALIDLAVEMLIGAVIELAGFLFLCCTYAAAPVHDSTPPQSPTRPGGASTPKRARDDHSLPQAEVTLPYPTTAAARAPIPDTYAKWLRFDFGSPLEDALKTLEGSRCYGACRDLLHRMGQHCLRVGWTNGTIDVATIRTELRNGRDWRTIEGHLARLLEADALAFDGTTFTIQHFLTANPSVQRREARLANARSKNRQRQDKHRNRLPTLQAQPLQEADLTPSCTSRNAEKPQSTTHRSAAAYAATHQPTPVQQSRSVDVALPSRPSSARRSYGAVRFDGRPEGGESHESWQRRLARIGAGDLDALDLCNDEASDAAEEFERSLFRDEPLERASSVAAIPESQPSKHKCIPVRLPNDPTPINQHTVAEACAKIGVSGSGRQAEDLFRSLAQEDVTLPELRYAAFCTATRRAKGALKAPENPVAYLLAVIQRQRAATAAA